MQTVCHTLGTHMAAVSPTSSLPHHDRLPASPWHSWVLHRRHAIISHTHSLFIFCSPHCNPGPTVNLSLLLVLSIHASLTKNFSFHISVLDSIIKCLKCAFFLKVSLQNFSLVPAQVQTISTCSLWAFSVLGLRLWNSLPTLLRVTGHNTAN